MSWRRRPLSNAQARRLTQTSTPWMSCDDCFSVLDQQVDGLLDAPAGHAHLPQELRVHLAGCPACYAEARALLTLAATDQAMSARRAARLLRVAMQPPAGAG